ncbi:MAG: AAA family ATPase [Desulfovibrio sp.]|nr:AAA family ATPase [Desulfovibrio sp.]
MMKTMALPIGIQSFPNLRARNYLYVDKTALLQRLIEEGRSYFLARPRRFGKSLTVSTLSAMFQGKEELFQNLACEEWVHEQARHPNPVLLLDLNAWSASGKVETLDGWLTRRLCVLAKKIGIEVAQQESCAETLQRTIESIAEAKGQVVVLVDEYDAPILRNLHDIAKAEIIREKLRDFYAVLKSCSEELRFVFMTGISKFNKVGIFSALNNLHDISSGRAYGTLTGYTQHDLLTYFDPFIESCIELQSNWNRELLLKKIEKYYDGYSFDGVTKVYNPFSILNFFQDGTFKNYWASSGEPSFLAWYLKQHGGLNPDRYSRLEVNSSFFDIAAIEQLPPEALLYQAGYLTIVEKDGDLFRLDYPNQEVRLSIADMYQRYVYNVPDYAGLGNALWKAFCANDLEGVLACYNRELSAIPYMDYEKAQEGFYRAIFLVILRAVNISVSAENPTSKGRSDCVIETQEFVYVFEFKVAQSAREIEGKAQEGVRQIQEKGYLEPYKNRSKTVLGACIVIDHKERKAYLATLEGIIVKPEEGA